MSRIFQMRLPFAALILATPATAILAMNGVQKQTVNMPDAIYNYTSSEIKLSIDPSELDAKQPRNIYVDRAMGAGGTLVNLALGSSTADATSSGSASARVLVYENLGFTEVGNYSGGDGMKSERDLADSLDVDRLKVALIPHDNPYGSVTVELIQKTYVSVDISYASTGATDQTKYFYFRVANTLIDQTLQETVYQWSAGTASVTTSGANAELALDNASISGGWSQQVDQGVNAHTHRLTSRISNASMEHTFHCTSPSDVPPPPWYVTVDCAFNWNLNTVDDNWAEAWPEGSTLEGRASYNTVIGFGTIKVLKNTDGTALKCPKTWHTGTDIGNPELHNDRVIQAVVTYSMP